MKVNTYYEYRSWILFWGMFLDGQKVVNKVISKYNKDGWSVVQFNWGYTKLSITTQLLIMLISFMTLGFLNYWVGFNIVFEKEIEAAQPVAEKPIEDIITKSDTDSTSDTSGIFLLISGLIVVVMLTILAKYSF